jgi:hypothetical protein
VVNANNSKEGYMKMNKVVAILAAVAVAVVLAAGPAAAQQKVIKIGALYPLTGNLASTGMDCKRGVDLAVEIINGKYDLNLPFAKVEGIPNLGGAKIEVIYADTKGDPGPDRRLPERGHQDRQPGGRAAEDSLRVFGLLLAHPDRARLHLLLPRLAP